MRADGWSKKDVCAFGFRLLTERDTNFSGQFPVESGSN